jgi:hypothetical protein
MKKYNIYFTVCQPRATGAYSTYGFKVQNEHTDELQWIEVRISHTLQLILRATDPETLIPVAAKL